MIIERRVKFRMLYTEDDKPALHEAGFRSVTAIKALRNMASVRRRAVWTSGGPNETKLDHFTETDACPQPFDAFAINFLMAACPTKIKNKPAGDGFGFGDTMRASELDVNIFADYSVPNAELAVAVVHVSWADTDMFDGVGENWFALWLVHIQDEEHLARAMRDPEERERLHTLGRILEIREGR